MSGVDGEICRGDDLNAAAVWLGIEFFELAGFDDGFAMTGWALWWACSWERVLSLNSKKRAQKDEARMTVYFLVTMA